MGLINVQSSSDIYNHRVLFKGEIKYILQQRHNVQNCTGIKSTDYKRICPNRLLALRIIYR